MKNLFKKLKPFEFETFETSIEQAEHTIDFEGKLYKSSRSENWVLLVPIDETNIYYEFNIESIANYIKLSQEDEDNLYKLSINKSSKFYKTELLSLESASERHITRVFRGEAGVDIQKKCSCSCSCSCNCNSQCSCGTIAHSAGYRVGSSCAYERPYSREKSMPQQSEWSSF